MSPRFPRARRFVAGAVVTLGLAAVVPAGAAVWSAQKGDEPPHAERRTSAIQEPSQVEIDVWNFTVAANANQAEWWYAVALLNDNYRPPVVLALRRLPAQVAPGKVASGGGATGVCGGATNGADRYIQRESGGDPNKPNAQGSGAYGCYQIMPSTWAASCSDLGAEQGSSASTQAACASRLPQSAWASSGPTG